MVRGLGEMEAYGFPANRKAKKLGFHYYKDAGHFDDPSLDYWLPKLQAAGTSWLIVYAPENGTVTGAYINGGFGRFISVNHGKDTDGNLLVSWYGHLNKWLVSPGQKVSKGQQIGLVGSTGVSTGPHLHFAVRENGQYVNTLKYYKTVEDKSKVSNTEGNSQDNNSEN